MRFESLTVARRLALMLLVALAGMVLLALAALYENRDDMREGYARNVRSQIELATGVLAHFHSLEQAGRSTARRRRRPRRKRCVACATRTTITSSCSTSS